MDDPDFVKSEFKRMIGYVDEDEDTAQVALEMAQGAIKQQANETVQEYFAKFEEKRVLCGGVDGQYAIAKFTCGLKPALSRLCQRDVHGLPFKSLESALRHA